MYFSELCHGRTKLPIILCGNSTIPVLAQHQQVVQYDAMCIFEACESTIFFSDLSQTVMIKLTKFCTSRKGDIIDVLLQGQWNMAFG